MNYPENSRESILAKERFDSLLALVVILAMGLGYCLLLTFSIAPQWQARKELASQLTLAEQDLMLAETAQREAPERLKGQVATAQAALNEAANLFLSESQAAEALNKLYQYASQSGVEITNLQTQPGPAGKKSAYDVRTFRLQVVGTFPKLTDLLSRIREATLEGFMITNVNITEGEKLHTLTMDITLYTSPYAPGGVVPMTPVVTPAATPTSPAQLVQQLAQRLDGAWAAENWAEVISLIEQILAINPGYANMTEKLYAAHVNYGRKLASEGKLEEAKEQFSHALAIKPDGAEAITGLRDLAGGTITPFPTPSLAPSPTPTSQHTIYVVRQGDTLYSIARRHGTTVPAIMAANGLTNYNIYVGQQLYIPTR